MKKAEKEKSVFWQAVGLAFKFGYTITIPLVALALAGRFLDKKFDSSPLLLLVGIVLSLVVSSIILLVKVRKVMEEIK
jgi:F0F1-type ATP synthase assembly protein I